MRFLCSDAFCWTFTSSSMELELMCSPKNAPRRGKKSIVWNSFQFIWKKEAMAFPTNGHKFMYATSGGRLNFVSRSFFIFFYWTEIWRSSRLSAPGITLTPMDSAMRTLHKLRPVSRVINVSSALSCKHNHKYSVKYVIARAPISIFCIVRLKFFCHIIMAWTIALFLDDLNKYK